MTETKKCNCCSRLLPVNEDQTDSCPDYDTVILDSAGIGPGDQNEFVCGACLAADDAGLDYFE